MTRKLSLKRDVLQELTSAELAGVAGGTKTTVEGLTRDDGACFSLFGSCMPYESCACMLTFNPACF